MDALKLIEHLSNVLTVEEYQAWKESDDYLWMMARYEGYRGAHMDKLVQAGRRRRSEAWAIAQDMARAVLESDAAEMGLNLDSDRKAKLIQSTAEKLLIEQSITPPTFVAWADCETCGRVAVPPGLEKTIINCPWCLND